MDPRELRRAFRDREYVSGSLIQIPEPALVEMLGEFVDFVIVDMEHSRADIETVEELVRAADAVDLVPLVRAPGPIRNHPDFIRRALDLGASRGSRAATRRPTGPTSRSSTPRATGASAP